MNANMEQHRTVRNVSRKHRKLEGAAAAGTGAPPNQPDVRRDAALRRGERPTGDNYTHRRYCAPRGRHRGPTSQPASAERKERSVGTGSKLQRWPKIPLSRPVLVHVGDEDIRPRGANIPPTGKNLTSMRRAGYLPLVARSCARVLRQSTPALFPTDGDVYFITC
jgi:hypothetical protein